MPRRKQEPGRKLRLKPADPFELIRWLARSQSDPRKAVAELVQNSLDAGARRVTIERVRLKGAVSLLIHDDGEGVLPEMPREDALSYLATHVGHSRKLKLDPLERQKRVIAGQYGVGLLGFWAVGGHLELRSRVGGSERWALRLEEDSPEVTLHRIPGRIDDAETYTEAAIWPLHPPAHKALGGRRLTDYLAAELRGQILRSGVEIEVLDRIARGTAQKRFLVAPLRFSGERLELPAELEVAGFPPLRIELYLARGAERPAIQVAAAGTLVADDIAELSALGIAGAPWLGRELVGLLDFAGFRVPPGSRRGVQPDAGADAFTAALERLRPLVEAELARFAREREASIDRDVLRDLRRALRGFQRRLPQYDLPRVARPAPGEPGEADDGETLERDEGEERRADRAAPALFPPGPLEAVRIVPGEVRLAPGAERRVRAVATDQAGRGLRDASLTWTLEETGGLLAIHGGGARPALAASPRAREGVRARLHVHARLAGREASAQAFVTVAADEEGGALGIPEPQLVSDAEGGWRSRMAGERWEVNDAHPDYRELKAEPRARVRYLLTLLAKEIVARSAGRPDAAPLLESMAEILALPERNLRGA